MEVKIITALQKIAQPFWRWLLTAFSAFGTELFFLLIFFIWFWCINKREAIHLFFVYAAGMLVNFILKDLIKRPRPFVSHASITNIGSESGYSLPSGHMQSFTMVAFGSLFLARRSKKNNHALQDYKNVTAYIFVSALIGCILVSLSRMFLGVHYLTDCLAAIFIGIVLAWFFVWVAGYIKKENIVLLFLGLAALLVLILFLTIPAFHAGQKINQVRILAAVCGICLGALLEDRYIHNQPQFKLIWQNIFAVLKGIVLTAGVYVVLCFITFFSNMPVFEALRVLLTVLFAMVVMPFILKSRIKNGK